MPMPSDRKPNGQSWESFTESRLREALESGAFDNLPGLGQPIPDIDEPWDENSWLRKKLRDEQIVSLPPILEARLRAEKFLESLPQLPTEAEVRRRTRELNEFIREAHFSHQPGPLVGVQPLDLEAVIVRWRTQRKSSA